MIWRKEIEILQALASTPTANISEKYLQSLVREISSVVEKAKTKKAKCEKKKLQKRTKLANSNSVIGQSPEPKLSSFFKTRRNLKKRQMFGQSLPEDMELNYPPEYQIQ